MNPLIIAEVLATAAAVGGQFYDSYTTYVGIFVQKSEVEGNTNPIAQWLTKNKYTTLLVKPIVALSTLFFFHLANQVKPLDIEGYHVSVGILFAAAAVLALLGFNAGRSNAAANAASKK